MGCLELGWMGWGLGPQVIASAWTSQTTAQYPASECFVDDHTWHPGCLLMNVAVNGLRTSSSISRCECLDICQVLHSACGTLVLEQGLQADHRYSVPFELEGGSVGDRFVKRDSGCSIQDSDMSWWKTNLQYALVVRHPVSICPDTIPKGISLNAPSRLAYMHSFRPRERCQP